MANRYIRLISSSSSLDFKFKTIQCVHPIWGLRIVYSMRYTDLNNGISRYKTVRTGVGPSYTHLTQPTEQAADWAGIDYTKPDLRPGGISIGAFCVSRAGLRARRPSYIGGTMLTTTQPQTLTHPNVVEVLAHFRQEWEQVAEGESLVAVRGSVGLILVDLVRALALRQSEQVQVLGSALHAELQSILVVIPESGKGF